MGRAKEIVMKVIPSSIANPFIKAHHYSGKVVNNSKLHFGVFLDGQLHGVMSYGPSLDKSKIIGLVEGTGWNEFLELNRMAFDSVLPRNSESRAISMSIKLLKKYAPQVKWIISFADACSCGDGTIYRASNFVLTGIKENLNLAELPDGTRIHKMTLASNPTTPRKELGGLTFFDVTGGTYNFNKYGGLDLSSTTDITAFVLVFPPTPGDDDGKYEILPFFWLPEETIDLRVKRDHVPYDIWARQGLVFTTEGNVIHYGYIEEFIEELGMRYNIREIAFDRWGAVQMTQNLEGLGFTVVPFGQGYKDMSPPTKELMKLVLEGRIAHGGHPVLRWMIDNVTIRSDPAGNIKADKEKSTEKIDGAVATIMALDRAIRHEGDGASVYDERGLFFI